MCNFGFEEAPLLSYVFFTRGLKTDSKKTDERIWKLQWPTYISEVKNLWGIVVYISRFSKNLGSHMCPIILQKTTSNNSWLNTRYICK